MTLVMAELAPATPSSDPRAFPKRFEDIDSLVDGGSYSIQGVGNNLAIAVTPLSLEILRDRATKYPRRVAVGAKKAWERFPEYRGEFLGTIERNTLEGIARGDLRLADTIVDDKLIGLRLKLLEHQTYSGVPTTRGAEFEEFVVDAQHLHPYEYVVCREPCIPTTVEGKFLFFCNYFSVRGNMGKDIIPGVKFFSPYALHAHTDFDGLWKGLNSGNMRAGLAPHLVELLPSQFTGVLVLDNPNQVYNEIVVRRILAAAAFAGTAYGKILGSAKLTKNSSQASRVTEFGTRPYCDHALPDKNIIESNNVRFCEILELISRGSEERLDKGKEDYRLLALDVVEDARRSSVPTLAYAQLWMAVEKLLAIRVEISAQISLALAAFSPVAERSAVFEKLKRGYDLRSNIVHGYSFKSSDFQVCPIDDIARLFRLLFVAALNYRESKQLFGALRNHVLSGVTEPFSSLPAVN